MWADQGSRSGTDRLRSFEEIYVQAGGDFTAVPWATLAPHPALVTWLDSSRRQPVTGP